VEQPQVRDTTLKLQELTAAAKPNLSDNEFRQLEELTEDIDTFAMDSDDYGQTDIMYHRIDTGEAQPIRQPPSRLPMAKQADVGEMLEDMQ
jgi:hypothetical protein